MRNYKKKNTYPKRVYRRRTSRRVTYTRKRSAVTKYLAPRFVRRNAYAGVHRYLGSRPSQYPLYRYPGTERYFGNKKAVVIYEPRGLSKYINTTRAKRYLWNTLKSSAYQYAIQRIQGG